MRARAETNPKYKHGIIRKAKYVGSYLIEITFYDDTVRVVDLETFFTTSKFGLIRKFAPLSKFRTFRIEDGTLCWGDNECDINPHSIYEGRYDAQLAYA